MSVTRVEGTRPVEAAQTIAANQPRSARQTKQAESGPQAEKHEEPAISPASTFKQYSLSFRFEKELNRVVVKVLDAETGEIVREIPPESLIRVLKQLRQLPGGLVDEEA